jgi:hypothetical protein
LAWEVALDEILTMKEIEDQYAPDWVLIAEPHTDEMQRLQSGRVIFHSPDRNTVWNRAREMKLDHVAVR